MTAAATVTTKKATATKAKVARKEPFNLFGYSSIELGKLAVIITVVHTVLVHSGVDTIVHNMLSALIL